MFDRKYLKNEIEKLDGALPDHVNLYLIGGGLNVTSLHSKHY